MQFLIFPIVDDTKSMKCLLMDYGGRYEIKSWKADKLIFDLAESSLAEVIVTIAIIDVIPAHTIVISITFHQF